MSYAAYRNTTGVQRSEIIHECQSNSSLCVIYVNENSYITSLTKQEQIFNQDRDQ